MTKEIDLQLSELANGAWRNQAIVNIREYLKEQLSEEMDSGRITIIA